jgi:hypothetical protein
MITAAVDATHGGRTPDALTRAILAGSGLAFLSVLLWATGAVGLVYAACYVIAVAPGLILGRRLTGSWHPAGIAIGGAIGYGAVQMALWAPIELGVPSAATFVLAWITTGGMLLAIARRIAAPVLPLAPATRQDLRALALTLVLVPVIMGPPYANLGARDEAGTRYYRAYFTADFVWHTALAAELGRYDSPPRNPYMASEPLHYYWTYFLLPSVAAQEAPAPFDDVQVALKTNALMSALFLVALLFCFVRLAVPSAVAAGLAVALGIAAASAEGTFALVQVWRTGAPLASLSDTNIDAITAWQFGGLRIDGLPRGLWYNPQHSFASALGLTAMVVAAAAGSRASRGAIWMTGAALGLATTFNPFVGAMFSAIYGLSVVADALRRPAALRTVLSHAPAAVGVGVGLGWCLFNDVAGGAGAAVSFGFLGSARNHTITSLLLSVGPVLLPALAGLWPFRRLPAQPAIVAAIGAGVALLVMHLVTLSESSWVGFRTGQLILLMLPVLVARVLWVASQRSATGAGLLSILILVSGLPTTLIDTYNAQDISNRREGPGFRWTLPVTPAQQEAFAWARRNLPPDATLQMEPILRGREHWSLIPTFAERRMMAGLPISLLPMPEYTEASNDVRRLFLTPNPEEAWRIARRRRIRYLYVDPEDRAAYPEGTLKFSRAPHFEAVYDKEGITLYRVR